MKRSLLILLACITVLGASCSTGDSNGKTARQMYRDYDAEAAKRHQAILSRMDKKELQDHIISLLENVEAKDKNMDDIRIKYHRKPPNKLSKDDKARHYFQKMDYEVKMEKARRLHKEALMRLKEAEAIYKQMLRAE